MATDIVGSLFGLSVPELMARRQQQQDEANQSFAANIARGSLRPGRTYAGALAGASLGQALGNKLFGVQDPMIERATALEDILKSTQTELGDAAADPTKLYPVLSQKLGEAGFAREAGQALQLGQEAYKTQSEIAKNLKEAQSKSPSMEAWKTLAGKSTPESVKASVDAGYDLASLKLKDGGDNPQEAYVKAVNTLLDNTASAADKAKAFQVYQFTFPVVSGGAFGQYIPQMGAGGLQFAPAPGSPEAQKIEQASQKQVKQLTSAWNKSEVINSNIDKAIPLISEKTTGAIGAGTRSLPFTKGTDAGSLASYIDTIKANIGFDQLQKMRTESPTGGALGQVAVKELDYLQAALGNLNPDLDAKVLKENLEAVKLHYTNFMNELEKEMQAAKAKLPQSQQTPGRSPTGALRTKTLNNVEYEEFQPGKWRVKQ